MNLPIPRIRFQRRKESEVNRHDVVLLNATLGDRIDLMYQAWVHTHGTAHLFFVGSLLYARGSKDEKAFAEGFVIGWTSAARLLSIDEG